MKENIGVYRGILFILGIVAGMMVPIQTSINSRLGRYTESSFYASTISFFVGTLFLFILNMILILNYLMVHFIVDIQLTIIGGLVVY